MGGSLEGLLLLVMELTLLQGRGEGMRGIEGVGGEGDEGGGDERGRGWEARSKASCCWSWNLRSYKGEGKGMRGGGDERGRG